MISVMKEAAQDLQNIFVRERKQAGGRVVGYSCTFIPEEIIHAAGLLPFRLRGIGTTSMSIGDSYFGAVNCSLPKCILQLAGQGAYTFLDGAVITNGCDSMRRLEECWRKASEDHGGTLPGYYEYFVVPHKSVDYSVDFYTEELRNMIGTLENHFRVKVSDTSLKKSIRLYNEGRQVLQKLDGLRFRKDVPISGEDAMAVLIAAHAMPQEQFIGMLRDTIDTLEAAPAVSVGKKRLMLMGSASDDMDFIRVIEGAGAIVVADTVCYGSRTYSALVDEKSDPVHALSSHYLTQSICPRMLGYYKTRLAYVMDVIRKAQVDGVILQNVRFCDLHGSENGIFERDLEAAGIPCMRLEREYGPLTETGRISMRIDAFMERISSRAFPIEKVPSPDSGGKQKTV
ncbi:MAG TPA: 2-hydroxyacyl-CoA dehydratase family protein [Deltaproteobacteria bacterium]|nr:2-hydroxyacyl-CoA dehydratase family protein [Deltaproteobacteria bacterium]